MHTLTATYRIVTPMFLGDADQNASAIRLPSVKGALRFWWRALNWGRFREQEQDDAAALKKLHAAEAQLFGSAADDENTKSGQSQFLLTLQSDQLKGTDKDKTHSQFENYSGARYLGYGLMEAFSSTKKNTQAGQLMRGCSDEGQNFTVKLSCRDKPDETIQQALIALGLLGGLGSRSRHGMGSLSLLNLCLDGESCWTAPSDRETYIKILIDFLSDKRTALAEPPYSAFSKTTRVDLLLEETSPYTVLDDLGRGELMYRSWGKDGKVLGQPSEQRFKPDHDWSKKIRPKDFHPQRIIFGLPHNYGKEEKLQVKPEQHERRASPLLFHVHELDKNSFVGVSILFFSSFLPAGEKINAGTTLVPAKIEWNILTNFLDGNKSDGTPRFPNKATLYKVTL